MALSTESPIRLSSPVELYNMLVGQKPNLFVNAGTPVLDCYLENVYPDGTVIYALAFLDETGLVKNSLIAIHQSDGEWRYRLINKKYYEWKYDNSAYATNRYYYAGQLNTIERLQAQIDSGCRSTVQMRCSDIILCANAFMAFIDCQTGSLTISESPACLGPGGGDGENGGYNINTVYMGGNIW